MALQSWRILNFNSFHFNQQTEDIQFLIYEIEIEFKTLISFHFINPISIQLAAIIQTDNIITVWIIQIIRGEFSRNEARNDWIILKLLQ